MLLHIHRQCHAGGRRLWRVLMLGSAGCRTTEAGWTDPPVLPHAVTGTGLSESVLEQLLAHRSCHGVTGSALQTLNGVYIPCLLNILGAVLFMRIGSVRPPAARPLTNQGPC